jgi:hypothetical protein
VNKNLMSQTCRVFQCTKLLISHHGVCIFYWYCTVDLLMEDITTKGGGHSLRESHAARTLFSPLKCNTIREHPEQSIMWSVLHVCVSSEVVDRCKREWLINKWGKQRQTLIRTVITAIFGADTSRWPPVLMTKIFYTDFIFCSHRLLTRFENR